MRKLSRTYLGLALLALAAGCNQLGAAGPSTTPGQPGIGTAVREYLARGEEEAEDYGFYSYLLLREAPRSQAIRERYAAAFDEFLRIPERRTAEERAALLNLTYTLVDATPPELVDNVIQGSAKDDATRQAAIDWLIDHHHYARSAAILRRLGALRDAGPYIVQAPKPLAGKNAPVTYAIVQNLSSFDPALIGEVLHHVLKASDEKVDWQQDELQRWLLDVRNVWEHVGVNAKRVAALVSLLPFEKLLDEAISVKTAPRR